MAERTVNIGLSLGADICWPIAYESLLDGLEPRPQARRRPADASTASG